jgi:hypothetical protein
MPYGLLADIVVAGHIAYVSYVLVGQLVILAGWVFKWGFIRNPWFRWTHLTAICIVALEAILHITCPLTTWENDLRRLAGETVEEGTFVGRLLHNLMFYTAPLWVFTACYIGFAALVIGTVLLVPPRAISFRWSRKLAVNDISSAEPSVCNTK